MPYPIETTAQLIACDLEPDMENSIWFASASDRDSFFQSKVIRTETNIQYVRESQNWRVNAPYDDIIGSCNYLRYRNKADGRWFYGFVTNIQYLNPNVCTCNFTLDAWVTYQFDLTWEDCFIERECVSDDSVGANILDEGINTGNMLITNTSNVGTFPSQTLGRLEVAPVIFLTNAYQWVDNEEKILTNITTETYGLPVGSAVWTPDPYNKLSPSEQSNRISNFLEQLAAKTKAEAIIYGMCIPDFILYDNSSPDSVGGEGVVINNGNVSNEYGYYLNFGSSAQFSKQITQTFTLELGNYTPINHKLYTYPYNYHYLTDNNGSMIPIEPHLLPIANNDELQRNITLNFSCALSPDAKFICYPAPTYRGVSKSTGTAALSALPSLALNTNTFANTLSGMSNRLTSKFVTTGVNALVGANASAATLAMGVVSQNPAAIASGAQGVTGSFVNAGLKSYEILSTIQDMAKQPYSQQGEQSGNTNQAGNRMNFEFLHTYIQPEIAKQIDMYFSMFGYKVNRVGQPEFATRAKWNYFKIPICNVHGNIPGDSMAAIKSMFVNGVTLWNDGNSVGNYQGGLNPIL